MKNNKSTHYIFVFSLFFLTLVTAPKSAFAVPTVMPETQNEASDSAELSSTVCTQLDQTEATLSEAEYSNYSRSLIMPADKIKSHDADKMFNLVNNYRKKIGLATFERDKNLCRLAESRGPEVFRELLVTGKLHSGLYNRDLPYYVTENMVLNVTEEGGFNWWLNSPIHYATIVGEYKYSCTKCFGHACIQLFSNYTAKIYAKSN